MNIDKLPKAVQYYIEELEAKLKVAERELQNLQDQVRIANNLSVEKGATGLVIVHKRSYEDTDLVLSDDEIIVFNVNGKAIRIYLRKVHEGYVLEVNGDREISIKPQAANMINIG